MIDLHCHLLPGIDDGPATLEESLALARAAAAGGTRTMIATPHIDHRWNVEPTEVAGMVDRMREALAEAHIELDVRAGGEIALSRLADLDSAQVKAVRLGGGPYMLLECPHRPTAGTDSTPSSTGCATGASGSSSPTPSARPPSNGTPTAWPRWSATVC